MINLLSDLFALAASLRASIGEATNACLNIVANIIKIKHNKKKNGGYISH